MNHFKSIAVSLVALLGLPPAISQPAYEMPISAVTPGAVSFAVTQENIKQTICVVGYTQTVRPSSTYTTKMKLQQLRDGPYKGKGSAADVEQDHLIPLAVGGDPTSRANLWPQTTASAKTKDRLEKLANKLVCTGKVRLIDMQREIAIDWVATLKKYGG